MKLGTMEIWAITCILEIILLCIAIYIGYRRNIWRGLTRTIYLFIIAILSYVIAKIISPIIANLLLDWIYEFDMDIINSLWVDSPETIELCKTIIAPYIVAVLFPALFIIFELLSLIKCSRVSQKLFGKINLNIRPRVFKIIGAAIGLINGFIFVSIALIPLCLIVALGGINAVSSDNLNSSDNFDYKANILIPASVTLNNITNIDVESLPEEYVDIFERDIDMTAEAQWLVNAAIHAGESHSNAKSNNASSKEAVFFALGAANENSGQSEVIPAIFMRIVLIASDKWGNDQEFLGIQLQANNRLASVLISETLNTLKSTTKDNVRSTVRTLMGNGYDKGVINNILILSLMQDEEHSSEELTEEKTEILAETLVEFGKNEDFKEITHMVSNDLRDEFAEETKDKLFPDRTSDSEKKEVATALVEEINLYNQSSELDDNAYDYETRVNNVAQYITEIDEKYNYQATESEAMIVAVSLVSYVDSTDNASIEGVLTYFGFSEHEIDKIINSTN